MSFLKSACTKADEILLKYLLLCSAKGLDVTDDRNFVFDLHVQHRRLISDLFNVEVFLKHRFKPKIRLVHFPGIV